MTMPYVPPAFGASQFDQPLWNALVSYSGHPLPLPGKNVSARFTPLERAPSQTPGLLVGFGGGERAVVVLTDFPFQPIFDAEFSLEDPGTLPKGLRNCLNEGILGLIWSALPEHDLGSCALLDSGDGEVLAELIGGSPAWFEVTISGLFTRPVAFMLACRAERLTALVVGGRLAPRQVWPSLKARITTEAFVTLGRMVMTVSHLRSLQPGDVLVLAAATTACGIRAGAQRHDFEQGEAGWTCRGAAPLALETAKVMTMDQISNSAAATDDLQVAIDFDIGQRSVSLAEIESWQSGAIVQMDLLAPQAGLAVTVRANGRVLATGDLVRIDDRLAVRLNRLLIGAGPST